MAVKINTAGKVVFWGVLAFALPIALLAALVQLGVYMTGG